MQQTERGQIGALGVGVGALLLLGSFVFLLQVTGIVEALTREPRMPSAKDSIPFGYMAWFDYFITRELFIGMHAWILWVVLRTWRAWSKQRMVTRVLLLLGSIVLAVTHGEGVWLARHGTGVGVW